MRAFTQSQEPTLLSKVRDRFNELSSDHRSEDDGRLCLPVKALLAHGTA
jgi:hypothetical protein